MFAAKEVLVICLFVWCLNVYGHPIGDIIFEGKHQWYSDMYNPIEPRTLVLIRNVQNTPSLLEQQIRTEVTLLINIL